MDPTLYPGPAACHTRPAALLFTYTPVLFRHLPGPFIVGMSSKVAKRQLRELLESSTPKDQPQQQAAALPAAKKAKRALKKTAAKKAAAAAASASKGACRSDKQAAVLAVNLGT